MDRKHEKCHLCEKAGKKFEFYINYTELETHFGEKHHLCPDADCRTSRFVPRPISPPLCLVMSPFALRVGNSCSTPPKSRVESHTHCPP